MNLLELLVKELPKRGGWPEGANYFVQDSDGLVKPGVDKDNLLYPKHGDWDRLESGSMGPMFELAISDDCLTSIVAREKYEAALAELTENVPQQVESLAWNGVGMPPVGTECEFFDCEEWNKVKIKFIGDKYVVVERAGHEVVYHSAEKPKRFRPIRTEAELRREEYIMAIDSIYGLEKVCGDNKACEIYEAIAAGKIPGVKLTD